MLTSCWKPSEVESHPWRAARVRFTRSLSVRTGAAQIEAAGSQVTVSPGWGDVVVVFEDGRAELVVVGVSSFNEHQLPGSANQLFRVRVFVEIRQHLARRCHRIVADVGQNLFDGRCALWL